MFVGEEGGDWAAEGGRRGELSRRQPQNHQWETELEGKDGQELGDWWGNRCETDKPALSYLCFPNKRGNFE